MKKPHLSIYVSQEELILVRKYALQDRTSNTGWIRNLLLKEFDRRKKKEQKN